MQENNNIFEKGGVLMEDKTIWTIAGQIEVMYHNEPKTEEDYQALIDAVVETYGADEVWKKLLLPITPN